MALRSAIGRVAAAFGASCSTPAPRAGSSGFSLAASLAWRGLAARSFHASSVAEASAPKLSGWAQWKRAQNKRNKALGARRWNARVLTKQARKAQGNLVERWKIFRGDQVMVNSGKDRGQVGTVTKVFCKENRLIVEGLNLVKKHVKRTEGNQGGVITMESPVHYSNVNLVDPMTGSPVRVGRKFLDDGTKVRVTRGGPAGHRAQAGHRHAETQAAEHQGGIQGHVVAGSAQEHVRTRARLGCRGVLLTSY